MLFKRFLPCYLAFLASPVTHVLLLPRTVWVGISGKCATAANQCLGRIMDVLTRHRDFLQWRWSPLSTYVFLHWERHTLLYLNTTLATKFLVRFLGQIFYRNNTFIVLQKKKRTTLDDQSQSLSIVKSSYTYFFPGIGAFLLQRTAMAPSASMSKVMSHSKELLGVAVRKVTPFFTKAL